MQKILARLLRSFLQGLLILCPIGITAYLIFAIFNSVDSLVPWVPRGLGFVIIIVFVTIVGFLGTRFFIGKAVINALGNLLEHTPGIKFIYTSVKDILDSFVGDKRRFNKPVWVKVNSDPEMWRIGFITQKDMNYLGIEDKVAVYLPHSYAIAGGVMVVERSYTKPVTTMDAAEAMKFAVSGGVTSIDGESENKK